MSLITPSGTRRARVLLLAAAVALGSSCGPDASTGPGTSDTRVATLTLSDSVVSVQVGFWHQLRAEPRSPEGVLLRGVSIAWSSDHPELAIVGMNGLVLGVAPGVVRISATAASQSATATVTVIPTVVASVALSRTDALLSPGRRLRVVATPLDSLGRSVSGRAVTFASSDTDVAQVAADGTVTAGDIGTASIVASADGGTGTLALTVIAATTIGIDVSGVAPAGAPSFAGFTVTLRTGDDSLVVSDSGGVAAQLAGALALPDTVQLSARANTAFAPGALKAPSAELPASVPVVFIPHTVNIASGSFAGMSFSVFMQAAVAPCILASAQCATGFGFYPAAFRTGVTAWDTFPVPVQIDGFSDSDTTLIWSALRSMEAALGRQLFTLANGQDSGIVVSTGLPPGITGFAGYTTWSVDARSRITSAHVWLGYLRSGSVVPHEFMHALGFGHTCSWPSVMGGYGCPQSGELTATDVAYYLLARGVFEAETPLRLPSGALPCGAMGVWAAAEDSGSLVTCSGDAWQGLTLRELVAPLNAPQATFRPDGLTLSMP